MTEKYFFVSYRTDITLERLADDLEDPKLEDLHQELPPESFISGALEKLDVTSAKALRKYGREFSKLVDHQFKIVDKVNNIISYLLSMQDHSNFQTLKLSGSGFIVPKEAISNAKIGGRIKFRLFLREYGLFIYGYGKIVAITRIPTSPEEDMEDSSQLISESTEEIVEVEFTRILPHDQELIIQAMTKEQQKYLQLRNNQEQDKN